MIDTMRIVVVEDEETVARRLMRLVSKILDTHIESLRHECTLDNALEYIREHPVDLLFLDLNLEGQDGFRLLTESVAGSFQTIIVSAQHDEAVRAFEYGVTDFVAKPYDEERLTKAIARVTERDDSLRQQLKYLAVKSMKQVTPIPIDTIAYIKGADDYSEIHCDDGTSHLHDKTLTALEHILPPPFERLHRSYIVNMTRVAKYRSEPGSRYLVRLTNGEELPVSRTRFKELKSRMQ